MLRPMTSSWDRAAAGYVEEWVPRFVPYHLDLVSELALQDGDRVLVVTAGPGAEAIAAARMVGPAGLVRATDTSLEMIRVCEAQARRAGLAHLSAAVAAAKDASGGPWDAIVCAFGLWQLRAQVRVPGAVTERDAALRAWRDALSPHGKVGILTWGPAEADEPFEVLARSLAALEPAYGPVDGASRAARASMEAMLDEAGLAMVRHTVIRHTMSFHSAEQFVRAMTDACTWRRIKEDLGDERLGHVARGFYEAVGGPDAPITFAPSASVVIAGLPGAELSLAGRPSVKAPPSHHL